MTYDYKVIFDEGDVLVVDKPPGCPSTGRKLTDPYCLQYALMQDYRQTLWAVHQLDAPTSGVLVFVRQKKMVEVYKKRMTFPQGQKTYLALCHGVPEWETQRMTWSIGKVNNEFGWWISDAGKTCATVARVLERGAAHALLSVDIETGRTHQIRVHLAALGFPLVGEAWYRRPACEIHPRHALHAWRLAFSDEEAPTQFVAPLREDLRVLAESLGISIPSRYLE